MAAKLSTAIRLTPEAVRLRALLAEHWGCDKSAAIERAIRDTARREGLE